MDIVQKYNICINVPSSQTFKSYLSFWLTPNYSAMDTVP
jgi:hypothetical protein